MTRIVPGDIDFGERLWKVFLGSLDSTKTKEADDEFVGFANNLGDAATLLASALAEREIEEIAASRKHIALAEKQLAEAKLERSVVMTEQERLEAAIADVKGDSEAPSVFAIWTPEGSNS